MSGQPLVVLTYPGHFLLTALTLKTYFQHHSVAPVTVIVDDLSDRSWPGYLDDCKNLYQTDIITTSSLPEAHKFKVHPWIRQQIVKLYLDQLLPFGSWFFSDGDVEYHNPAPYNATPYTFTHGGEVQDRQNKYVSFVLGIDNPGIYTEHPQMNWVPGTRRHQVCVSNPPFRTMQAKVLQQLRKHIEKIHHKTVADIQLTLDTNTYLMSEWELIANFEKEIKLVYYPTVPIGQSIKPQPSQPNYCSTCFSSDSAFDREWWQSKGITVSDQLWQEVARISK